MGIAVDAHGNAYVTGTTGSADFPLKNAFQHQNYNSGTAACLPCFTAFVTKLDAAGNTLIFSTYLGGHRLCRRRQREWRSSGRKRRASMSQVQLILLISRLRTLFRKRSRVA